MSFVKIVQTALPIALAAVAVLAARPAEAQGSACAERRTQVEANACADSAYGRADDELNAVYRRVSAKLGAEERPRLRAVQRAWIAFRVAHCEFLAERYEGGSIQPYIRASCLEKVTRERTGHLRALERDLGR